MQVSSCRAPSDGHRFRLRSRGGHAQFNSPHFMSSLLTVKCRKSAHTALERGVVCIVYMHVVISCHFTSLSISLHFSFSFRHTWFWEEGGLAARGGAGRGGRGRRGRGGRGVGECRMFGRGGVHGQIRFAFPRRVLAHTERQHNTSVIGPPVRRDHVQTPRVEGRSCGRFVDPIE